MGMGHLGDCHPPALLLMLSPFVAGVIPLLVKMPARKESLLMARMDGGNAVHGGAMEDGDGATRSSCGRERGGSDNTAQLGDLRLRRRGDIAPLWQRFPVPEELFQWVTGRPLEGRGARGVVGGCWVLFPGSAGVGWFVGWVSVGGG
jgi:hypothetical protein